MNKPNLKIVLSTVFILALTLGGIFGYRIAIGSIPSGGPYYLQVPTSTWTYQIGQFSNDSYYMVNGSTWEVDYQNMSAISVFQRAINETATLGGGTVFVKAGLYRFAATSQIGEFYQQAYVNFYDYDYIELVGEGWNTIIKADGWGNYSVFGFFGSTSNPNCGCAIKNLQIDGNETTLHTHGGAPDEGFEKNGIRTHSTVNSTFEHLYIHHCGRTGIYDTQDGNGNFISNNLVSNNYRYGISYTSSNRGRVIGNVIQNSGSFGLNWDATAGPVTNTVIEANLFENNTGCELFAIGTSDSNLGGNGTVANNQFFSGAATAIIKTEYIQNVIFSGNTLRMHTYNSGTRHFFLAWTDNCTIANNILSGPAYYDLEMDYASHNIIIGNIFEQCYSECIYIHGDSGENSSGNMIVHNEIFKGGITIHNEYVDHTTIESNEFVGSSVPISGATLGVSNVIRWNMGYKTEASGSAIMSNTATISIAHGLAATPVIGFCSFNASQSCYWWVANATYVDVTVGLANFNGTIYWDFRTWNYP